LRILFQLVQKNRGVHQNQLGRALDVFNCRVAHENTIKLGALAGSTAKPCPDQAESDHDIQRRQE
jgi:hypothetical protein